jgi:hypothetical protein
MKIIIIISISLLWLPSLEAQNCDTSYVMIVKPYSEVLIHPDPHNPIDSKITSFDFARKLYDALSQYKQIDLRSRFDEIKSLTELIKEYRGKEFISGALKIIPYSPDLFLFSSIDKEMEKIIFRTEILDLSTKSRAVSIKKIGFKDFFDDAILDDNINDVAEELVCKLTGCCSCCGFISLDDYMKKSGNLKYRIGIGFGFSTGNEVALENISRDLRWIPPHPDDLINRGNDILPVNIPDNYLVRENRADINLGQRISLDFLQISLWGIVNLSIRSTQIKEPGKSLNQNLFRKWYVTSNVNDPDNPNSGTAYIYYSIQSKSRYFFSSKSFSLPLFITYPVLYFGREKDITCKILGGTNILLPAKIELESEKGWYRFGEYEVQDGVKTNIGELKEIEWFGGFEIEDYISEILVLNFQAAIVVSQYKEDFNVPLTLTSPDKITTSLRLNLFRMF